jgi:hypothetical protein
VRSRTARRIIFGAAIIGTIGAIVTGPLLALRWMEGSMPLSPWDPGSGAASSEITGTIELPRDSHAFTWPGRDGARPAPTLRMRAAPTDWHARWTPGAAPRQLALAGDTPAELAFDVIVPDGEAIAPEAMGPLCDRHPGEPGACRIGHARVRVLRDDTDGDRHDIVRGVRPPPAPSRRSADGTAVPVRLGFWTKIDTSDGQRTFLGWDCADGAASLPASLAGTASPAPLFRCHAPSGWLERTFPAIAGVEQAAVYQACDAAGRCELLFPFHGRLVVLDFDTLPPGRDIEPTRLRLFHAAWHMLNRMHVDALYPHGALAALPAAQAQLGACRAVAAAADLDRSPDSSAALSAAERHQVDILALTCRRAAEIATAFSGSASGEAVKILSEALPALAKLTAPFTDEAGLYQAWITAAEASQGDTATPVALALAGLLGRTPGVARDQPGFAVREGEIQRARALVASGNDTLPDEARAVLVGALVRQYRLTARENEAIGILEEHVEGLARIHGEWHPLVVRPLIRLGTAQRDRDNLIGLRRTAERLLGLWQAKGSTPDAAAPEDWDAALEAEAGFAVVQFQRTIALRDGSAATVVPSVIARMTRRLGATHPFVRAAQSGQTEPPATSAGPSHHAAPQPASAR